MPKLQMFETKQEADTKNKREVVDGTVHIINITPDVLHTLRECIRFARGKYGHYTQKKRDGRMFWWGLRHDDCGNEYIMLTTWENKRGEGKRYFIEAKHINAIPEDID